MAVGEATFRVNRSSQFGIDTKRYFNLILFLGLCCSKLVANDGVEGDDEGNDSMLP